MMHRKGIRAPSKHVKSMRAEAGSDVKAPKSMRVSAGSNLTNSKSITLKSEVRESYKTGEQFTYVTSRELDIGFAKAAELWKRKGF